MLLGLVASVVGIALLSRSADVFVDGAARLARALRVPPVVVGAVVVGFGTSAPEMLVSGIAAGRGDADLGIGNIIGSNVANLSLILGSAALLILLKIDSRILWREAAMATVAVFVFAVAVQGGISRTEGAGLLVLMGLALWILIGPNGSPSPLITEVEDITEPTDSTTYELFRTVIGLVGTVGGSWLLVEGATRVADELGLNDGFIGLTLVAIGTSLPELVTAVAAARAGHDELIVGNLLGSNLFNSLAVAGVVGLAGDGTLVDSSLAGFDTGMMLVVCVGAFLAMWTRRELGRLEGGVLLAVFFIFLLLTYVGEITDEGGEATRWALAAMIPG